MSSRIAVEIIRLTMLGVILISTKNIWTWCVRIQFGMLLNPRTHKQCLTDAVLCVNSMFTIKSVALMLLFFHSVNTKYSQKMAQIQKLTRNLFLTLHGHNVHCQQRQLSKFLVHYQQLVFHAYCGAPGPSWKPTPRSRDKHEKLTAGSACKTWTVAAPDGVRFTRVRW
jgi:hypothetical protein